MLKPQLPPPYNSIWEVYREMVPALLKQCRDPEYFTDRSAQLPPPLPEAADGRAASLTPDADGWVAACATGEVAAGDVERFDVGPRTYCVYHAADDGKFYATAGRCTHGAADLSDGLVTGNLIECPKHNGCFDFKTGEAKRLPVRTRLATFPVKVEGQTVYVRVGGGKHVQVSYEDDEGEGEGARATGKKDTSW